MDPAVIKRYRELLQAGFRHTGTLENPSLFLDARMERIPLCGQAAGDYLNFYFQIEKGVIEDIRYMCMCEPTTNVVVEALCGILKGKTIAQAKALTAEDFYREIGGRDETVVEKVAGVLQLLERGIRRFETGATQTTGEWH